MKSFFSNNPTHNKHTPSEQKTTNQSLGTVVCTNTESLVVPETKEEENFVRKSFFNVCRFSDYSQFTPTSQGTEQPIPSILKN